MATGGLFELLHPMSSSLDYSIRPTKFRDIKKKKKKKKKKKNNNLIIDKKSPNQQKLITLIIILVCNIFRVQKLKENTNLHHHWTGDQE